MAYQAVLASFVAVCSLCLQAHAVPVVRLGGVIGERFDTAVRGNVLKLDLEKDFFPPFVKRNCRNGAFVGLGKHADAVFRAPNLEENCRHEDELFVGK